MGQIKPAIKDDIDSSYGSSNQTTQETSNAKKKMASKSKSDENLEMDDLLNLIDTDTEKSNDSADSKSKHISSKKRSDEKSPVKKRKRLNDDEDRAKKSELDDEDSNDMDLKIEDDNDGDDDENDDLESIEKLKAKAFKSVKKEFMAMGIIFI
jgi:hypothetical protein